MPETTRYGKFVMNDFDGNILDTMEAHGKLAGSCINKHFGIDVEEAIKKYHSTTGIPFPKQLQKLFPGENYRMKREECVNEYIKRKTEEVYFGSHLFPDVIDFLKMLERLAVYSTISTSTEHGLTTELLKRHDIYDAFWIVRGMEDGSKPQHIAEIKTCDPRIIFFTGDSRSDVKLSEHGVITVGRSGPEYKGMLSEDELKEAGADYVFERLTEIEGIVDNIPPLLKSRFAESLRAKS